MCSSDLHRIADNPVNAPYALFVWLLTAILHRSILAARIVAACFGLAVGLLFFAVARAWCTYRGAFLSTVMFVTSAGLLHTARLGTGYILQMGILALLGCALWYRSRRQHRPLIAYCIAALFTLLLYVPGMIWFEVLGLFLVRGTVQGQLERAKRSHLTALLAVFIILLVPLAIASARKPGILLQIAGLPHGWAALTQAGSRLLDTVLGIAMRSNGSPLLWIGHAPLLDAVEAVLALLGAFYLYREVPRRGLFLLGLVVIGILLVALGGSVTVACLVPALYLLVATGLDHLLGQWLTVFPRNPVARLTGIGVICLMLTCSVLYQLRSYYVAWPHDPATRQTFNHPAP